MSKIDAREALRALILERSVPSYSRVGRLACWLPTWLIGRGPDAVPREERERLA